MRNSRVVRRAPEPLPAHPARSAATRVYPNERLRIQAGIEPDYTVAARPGEFPELGQPTAVAVPAAKPETGELCERETGTTAAAHREIFAAALQDHYISKSTAADAPTDDAPTGNTLNEPEQCAFTTGPRPHAFGTKSVNLAVYSRAKVGPLARIRIADEVYIRILLAAAFGPSFLYAGQTKGVTLWSPLAGIEYLGCPVAT